MQIFIVQGYLKHQGLLSKVDGQGSKEFDVAVDRLLAEKKVDLTSTSNKILLVEQLLYKELGYIDAVTGKNSEEFQHAREKYLLEKVSLPIAPPTEFPPNALPEAIEVEESVAPEVVVEEPEQQSKKSKKKNRK